MHEYSPGKIIYLPYNDITISINELKAKHWTNTKGKIDIIKALFSNLIIKNKLPKFNKIELYIRFNTGHDVDNIVGTSKFFIDMLVKKKRLKNDSKKYYAGLCIKPDESVKKGYIIFEIIWLL